MIEYTILNLKWKNHYSPIISTSYSLDILTSFLTGDVGYHGVRNWIEWARDSLQNDITSNYAALEKEDDHIIMGCILEDDPFEYSFECTIEQFIDILQTWDMLCKQKPEEIVITQENGKIQMIGRNKASDQEA